MPDESEWGGWSHKTDRWLTAETHGGIKHADEHSPNLVHNAHNVPTQLRPAYFLQALHSLCIHWSTQEKTSMFIADVSNLYWLSLFVNPRKIIAYLWLNIQYTLEDTVKYKNNGRTLLRFYIRKWQCRILLVEVIKMSWKL